ncbi:MAG: hypothetical protein QOE64_693, partial [Frankiales bacterium]|nr:hypothetical protein [Frankiales bacterium]
TGQASQPELAIESEPEPMLAVELDGENEPEPVTAAPRAELKTGSTDKQAEADGVAPGKRATVPSWDDILFGTRPPE